MRAKRRSRVPRAGAPRSVRRQSRRRASRLPGQPRCRTGCPPPRRRPPARHPSAGRRAGTDPATYSCPGKPKRERDHLSVGDLKIYISDNNIERKDILRIKIRHNAEDAIGFNRPLKETLDFIGDEDKVLLTGGKWMRFNQDYLNFLDDFLRSIEVEETEPQFLQIFDDEPDFNSSSALKNAGYESADKNFKILETKSPTPIEAWDLRKDSTVYAVKFGTPQKLNYVCDQATTVLELIRNKAGVRKVPNFQRYCLWLC